MLLCYNAQGELTPGSVTTAVPLKSPSTAFLQNTRPPLGPPCPIALGYRLSKALDREMGHYFRNKCLDDSISPKC